MKKIAFVCAGLALSGCATPAGPPMIWTRIDGKSIQASPPLQQQLSTDLTICTGETQKSAVGQAPVYYQGLGGAIAADMIAQQRSKGLTDILKGCMAQRGYMSVPMPAGYKPRDVSSIPPPAVRP